MTEIHINDPQPFEEDLIDEKSLRPNKIDSRSKKTEEEKDKSGKEIAAGYLPPLVLTDEVKPSLIDKIKNIFSNG